MIISHLRLLYFYFFMVSVFYLRVNSWLEDGFFNYTLISCASNARIWWHKAALPLPKTLSFLKKLKVLETVFDNYLYGLSIRNSTMIWYRIKNGRDFFDRRATYQFSTLGFYAFYLARYKIRPHCHTQWAPSFELAAVTKQCR